MVLIGPTGVCSMLLKPLWAALRMGTQRWILVCIGTLDRLIAVVCTVIRFIVGLLENVLLVRVTRHFYAPDKAKMVHHVTNSALGDWLCNQDAKPGSARLGTVSGCRVRLMAHRRNIQLLVHRSDFRNLQPESRNADRSP